MSDTPTAHNRPKAALTALKCSVCKHPDRAMFDAGLVDGSLTQTAVADAVGCSRRSVGRHVKNHLVPMAKEIVRLDPTLQVDILYEVRNLISGTKQLAEEAEAGGHNWQQIRAYRAELRTELELLAKLFLVIAPTDEGELVRSKNWIELRGLLLITLAPHPKALEAVSMALEQFND